MPSVTFAPIASGGVNQQPITSFTYRTIGVNIELTPRLHHDDDISLRLKLEVSSLSGVGLQQPADLRHALRRDDHPAARRRDQPAGRSDPRRGAARRCEGIPGLSDLPVIGRLFGHNAQGNQADRHRADADAADRPRARPRSIDDLRPFRVGRDCERRRLRAAAAGAAAAAGRQPPQDDDGAAPANIFPPGTPTGPPGQMPADPRRRRRVRRRRRTTPPPSARPRPAADDTAARPHDPAAQVG